MTCGWILDLVGNTPDESFQRYTSDVQGDQAPRTGQRGPDEMAKSHDGSDYYPEDVTVEQSRRDQSSAPIPRAIKECTANEALLPAYLLPEERPECARNVGIHAGGSAVFHPPESVWVHLIGDQVIGRMSLPELA